MASKAPVCNIWSDDVCQAKSTGRSQNKRLLMLRNQTEESWTESMGADSKGSRGLTDPV